MSRTTPRPGGVGLAILALALILRVWGVGTQSFSMDEVYELQLARESFGAIVVHADGLPPLYDLLLHGWLSWFGSDTAARWLSVLVGTATVWAMWRLGTAVGGRAVGLASAALLAISPMHVYYSQEVRSYGLLFLWSVLAIASFIRARDTGDVRAWVGFGVAATLGLYTHYYFSLLLVGLVLSVAAEPAPRSWRPLLVSLIVLAALALPWAVLAIEDFRLQRTFPEALATLNPATLAYTGFTLLAGYNLGPSLRELHTITSSAAALEAWPWAVALAIPVGLLAYGAFAERSSRRGASRLLVVVGVPLILCGVLGAVLAVGYRVRYVSWATAPVLTILAIGAVARWKRISTRVAAAALVALCLTSLVRRETDARYMTEDARSTARWIERDIDSTAPIFVVSEYMAMPVEYYLSDRWALRKLPNVRDSVTLQLSLEQIRAAAPPGAAFWLLYSRPFHGDPAGLLLTRLVQRAGLTRRAGFPGMEIYGGVTF